MTQIKWFLVSMDPQESEEIKSRLTAMGFTQQGEEYCDAQERVVRIRDARVQIGIPVSDVVSENEQLEFLLGILGLDEDNVQGV